LKLETKVIRAIRMIRVRLKKQSELTVNKLTFSLDLWSFAKARTSNISLQTSDIVSMFDINIIQSALQSLEEERAHKEN